MPFFGKTGLPTSHGRLKPEWNDCRIVLPFSHSLPTENVPKLYDTIELLIIFTVTSPVVYICLQKAIQGRHVSKNHQHLCPQLNWTEDVPILPGTPCCFMARSCSWRMARFCGGCVLLLIQAGGFDEWWYWQYRNFNNSSNNKIRVL